MLYVPKWLVALIAVVIVVGLAAPVLADEAKVKIKSVSADKKMFVATDKNDKEMTFTLADDGKVTLADKEIKLTDLKAGDAVTVTYRQKGHRLGRQERLSSRRNERPLCGTSRSTRREKDRRCEVHFLAPPVCHFTNSGGDHPPRFPSFTHGNGVTISTGLVEIFSPRMLSKIVP